MQSQPATTGTLMAAYMLYTMGARVSASSQGCIFLLQSSHVQSTTTPDMNACAVSIRSPGPEGSTSADESDKTNPPARMAVDRASREEKNCANEPTTSAPKRRNRANEPTEAAKSGRRRANEPIRAPSEPTSCRENRQRQRIPPLRSTRPRSRDYGISHALAPVNGHSTWVMACNRLDASCAGCSTDNESADSPREARITRKERGIGREGSSVSRGCIGFSGSGEFVLQSRSGEVRRDRRVGANERRRPGRQSSNSASGAD